MWLARFVDKTHLHHDGQLPADFEPFWGHRLATDGTFLAFFELDFDALVAAIRSQVTDTKIGQWFTAQPTITTERIDAWNALAPSLGLPGQPMERAFRYARRQYYGGEAADPRVVSVFTGIAWDEGYLDDWPGDS